MLTTQQLIKVLRQLQNSASANNGSDLFKTLKQAATTDFIPPAGMVSSCSAQNMTSTACSKSPQQPQQTSDDSSQQQQKQNHTQVDSRTRHNIAASLILHLNESSLADVVVSTTQDSYKATTTTLQYLHRSKQIQIFYQQQLHHFHTQHNRSEYAKQKQTQFSMSSIAAEPLALKQDEIVVNGNSDNTSADNAASTSCGSTNKPCFNTGLAEILQFMELIGNLKHTKRTGWVLRDVNDCESISGHMYRMSMMTFLLDGSEGLNQIRCMELALVHDLAESLVGDITPFCGVSKQDKRTMEFKAMDDICKLIEPRGKRIMELFQEYEHGESAESKFVKDLDRLDMVMQAYEYEKRDNCLLKHQEFFDSTEGKFNHPFVKKLVAEIYEQRKVLAKHKGALAPPSIHIPNMDLPPQITANGHCLATSVLEQVKEKTTSSSSS